MGLLIDVGLVTFVSSAVSAGAGAFIASYLKKKGENLATKEDLADLVKQVQAVTAATKEIESTIEKKIWSAKTVGIKVQRPARRDNRPSPCAQRRPDFS